MKNMNHRDGAGMETDSDFKIKIIPHDEVDRGVDEALVGDGQGRTGKQLTGDAVTVAVAVLLAMVALMIVAAVCA